MSRDKFAVRMINLPFGITAKEIISNIKTIGTLTCYIPRSRNYRHRSETIISFESEEVLESAIVNDEVKESDYNEPEVDSQMDFDELNSHNAEGSAELKNKNEDKFGRLLQVVEQVDQRMNTLEFIGRAEINYGESRGQWYKDNNDKFCIHCSDNRKEAGVALIISKPLNKYICKKREYEGRAICVDLVLSRKMTICIIQVYLPSKKSDKVNIINWIKTQLNEAQTKKKKVIVMRDFNAVPSLAIDRNNNSYSHFPESKIFLILSSYNLIDYYRIMFPENTGYIWKRDNSNEESRIDAIWMLHR
ncbi:10047_t:CDS:2 [Diversispora eburnea]|uniref:10047_t:CDS:1 n=1 Tax=Diversispora eburnea TaxID=1213867 RepID=A0A9N9GLA8_9GLOM|nr:10047_t:CDS:2 [Diversispora eburnea]